MGRRRAFRGALAVVASLLVSLTFAACGEDPPAAPTCPTTQPTAGGVCRGELTCDFGSACCCGTCRPTNVCSCEDGVWACAPTGACSEAQCSPGCDLGKWATPAGCLTCEALRTSLATELASAALAQGACVAHADCQVAQPELGTCGELCPVATTDAAAFGTAAATLGKSWCGTQPPTGYCPGETATCEPARLAACVEGVCVTVTRCDEPPEGVTSLCDDGNPCTADGCGAAGDCVHTPLAGACDGPCQVGGTCAEGQCVVSGPAAWQRTDAAPGAQAEADVVAASNGDLVVGGTEVTGDGVQQVRLARWTAAGEPVSSLTYVGLGAARLVALAPGVDGGVALLAETRVAAGEPSRVWLAFIDAAGTVGAQHVSEEGSEEVPVALAGAGSGPFYVGLDTGADLAVRAVVGSGGVLWSRPLGAGEPPMALGALASGVLVVAPLPSDLHVLRIEATAEGETSVAWDHPFVENPGVVRTPRFLEALADGRFFLGGLRDDVTSEPPAMSGFVTLFDAEGEPVGEQLVEARPIAGALTPDGQLVTTGTRVGDPADVWVGRFEADAEGPDLLNEVTWPAAALLTVPSGIAGLAEGVAVGGSTFGDDGDLWLLRSADVCATPPCTLEGCTGP